MVRILGLVTGKAYSGCLTGNFHLTLPVLTARHKIIQCSRQRTQPLYKCIYLDTNNQVKSKVSLEKDKSGKSILTSVFKMKH